MDILGLLREWLEIRQDRKDHCKSCDILQEQLVRALDRETRLLAMMNKPEPTVSREVVIPQPIQSKQVPWHIKRQLLEAEDRVKAQTMREAASAEVSKKPITEVSEISVGELEKELGIGEG